MSDDGSHLPVRYSTGGRRFHVAVQYHHHLRVHHVGCYMRQLPEVLLRSQGPGH